MGSKSRIAKEIVPLIQYYIQESGFFTYVEPFCGGCNIVDKIDCKTRIASDRHYYLIELYKNLNLMEKLPKFVTKEHYSDVRDCFNKELGYFEDWYIGAIGFLASYNGRFFDGGYAGLVNTKTGTVRNYYDEAKRNLIEQAPKLTGIEFVCSNYKQLSIDINNVVYCDPPYKNTKQYGVSKNFDYSEFWDWVRQKSKDNIVLVSEHQAPNDFKCIWEAPIKRTIDNNKRVDTVERLFKIRD